MKFETVLYNRVDNLVIISFNRPEKRNAINRQLILDFMSALKNAEADMAVKVVIVKGEGKAFCAGDDLSEDHRPDSIEEGLSMVEELQDITRIIMRIPKPVIAAVHGYALGAGCEWAMNCDLRIAADGAHFGFPETSVGATVTNAGTKMIPFLIGLSRAKEMVFTGEWIDASQAEQWGLVNRVVPLENLEKTAIELAGKITRNSALAIALSKKALNQGLCLSFEETLNQESRDIALVIQTLESEQRAKAALSKTLKT